MTTKAELAASASNQRFLSMIFRRALFSVSKLGTSASEEGNQQFRKSAEQLKDKKILKSLYKCRKGFKKKSTSIINEKS